MKTKVLCAAALLWFCAAAFADQKAEADLRARLQASEAARAQATADRAELTAILGRLTANAEKQRSNQVTASLANKHATNAQNVAEENAELVRVATAKAAEAAANAQIQSIRLQRETQRGNESLQLAVVTQIVGFLAIVAGFIFNGWRDNRNHRWIEASLTKIARVGVDTHTLVNNAFRVQLQLTATSARALADETGDPEHIMLAQQAERLLAEHEVKQAVADAAVAARKQTDPPADPK